MLSRNTRQKSHDYTFKLGDKTTFNSFVKDLLRGAGEHKSPAPCRVEDGRVERETSTKARAAPPATGTSGVGPT